MHVFCLCVRFYKCFFVHSITSMYTFWAPRLSLSRTVTIDRPRSQREFLLPPPLPHLCRVDCYHTFRRPNYASLCSRGLFHLLVATDAFRAVCGDTFRFFVCFCFLRRTRTQFYRRPKQKVACQPHQATAITSGWSTQSHTCRTPPHAETLKSSPETPCDRIDL